ncbi:MAG: sodium/glutamate symporter [Sporomusaceae bacterium]|nr:sodium/glutamate symporter [Sporomusaceae bacterium]
MDLTAVLRDFAAISVLLAAGYFLRKSVKLFQTYFIPASLIGGVLGLLLGPQVLGLHTSFSLVYSDSISQWATILLAVVFAAAFLGEQMGRLSKPALSATLLAGTSHQLQAVFGVAVAFLLAMFIPDLPLGFGLLPVYALYGGYGFAIAAGVIFADSGYWADGVAVGATLSTLGIIFGIILGMIIINIGVRKGVSKQDYDAAKIAAGIKTGYVEVKEREPIGLGVSKPSSLDPLALQLALVGIVIACGVVLRSALISLDPFWNHLPLFASTLICSGLAGIVLDQTGLAKYVDKETVNRISGVALDYMIAAAIATTSITVFATYIIPMTIMALIMFALTVWVCFYFGKRWCSRDWFEVSLGIFGMAMGVLSTGLLLIKVVDPDHKTIAAETAAAASTLGYVYQLPYVLLFPFLIMSDPQFVFICSVVILVAFLLIGEVCFKTRVKKPLPVETGR